MVCGKTLGLEVSHPSDVYVSPLTITTRYCKGCIEVAHRIIRPAPRGDHLQPGSTRACVALLGISLCRTLYCSHID
jgi:hypothetical protein